MLNVEMPAQQRYEPPGPRFHHLQGEDEKEDGDQSGSDSLRLRGVPLYGSLHLGGSTHFLTQALEKGDHKAMTSLGYGPAGWGIEVVSDARELDNELVDRGMDVRIISLSLPSFEIDGFDRGPKTLTVGPTVGEGSRHTHSADGVELVSIIEHLGFERRGFRLGPEAMGRDGLDDLVNLQRRMTSQDLLGSSGSHYCMIDVRCLGLTASNVVEQDGCSHDLGISILSPGNALGELQHAQDMVEVVHGVLAVVKTPCFSDGDHETVSDALQLLPEFLVD